jgi:hypothetical protein
MAPTAPAAAAQLRVRAEAEGGNGPGPATAAATLWAAATAGEPAATCGPRWRWREWRERRQRRSSRGRSAGGGCVQGAGAGSLAVGGGAPLQGCVGLGSGAWRRLEAGVLGWVRGRGYENEQVGIGWRGSWEGRKGGSWRRLEGMAEGMRGLCQRAAHPNKRTTRAWTRRAACRARQPVTASGPPCCDRAVHSCTILQLCTAKCISTIVNDPQNVPRPSITYSPPLCNPSRLFLLPR